MSQLNKPAFRRVSPIVYYCSWGFAVTNIFFIAPSLFFGGSNGLALVQHIPSKVWSGVFVALGLTMAFALLSNNWRLIKYVNFTGCLIKSLFTWALIVLTVKDVGAIGITGVWTIMIYVQAVCIIFFTPEVDNVTYN